MLFSLNIFIIKNHSCIKIKEDQLINYICVSQNDLNDFYFQNLNIIFKVSGNLPAVEKLDYLFTNKRRTVGCICHKLYDSSRFLRNVNVKVQKKHYSS